MSELFCRGPFHLWLDRHDDMQPFAACRLYETLKPLLLQHSPQLQSGFCHRTPRQGLVRIEIEDQSIWPLEIIILRSPGMHLQNPHLRQSRKRLGGIQRHIRFDLSSLVGNLHATNSFWQGCIHMLLKEARMSYSVGTTHQAQWPSGKMRQHPGRYRPVVVREHLLSQSRLRIKYLVRMRQPHRSMLSVAGSFRRHRQPLLRTPVGYLALVTLLSRLRLSLLANHFRCRLVLTQPEERRLTNEIIRSPGGEPHLHHHLRLYPMHTLSYIRGHAGKRTGRAHQLLQPIAQHLMSLLCEPRSGAPRIGQLTTFVITQQQRPDTMDPTRRQCVATDHKLLLMQALHLQPVATAS